MKLLSKLALSAAMLAIMPFSAIAADTYAVDVVHSSILFKIKHLDTAYVYGRFNDFSGNVVFDKNNDSKNAVEIEIQTNSVDTGVKKRDDHLRSPDFFNVKEFPKMSFKSTSVKKGRGDTYKVTGDFTMHGVTKEITVDFVKLGENKRGMKTELRGGGEATFKIKRSDFGMSFMSGMLGEEVSIIVSLEGIKQ